MNARLAYTQRLASQVLSLAATILRDPNNEIATDLLVDVALELRSRTFHRAPAHEVTIRLRAQVDPSQSKVITFISSAQTPDLAIEEGRTKATEMRELWASIGIVTMLPIIEARPYDTQLPIDSSWLDGSYTEVYDENKPVLRSLS